MAEIRESKLPCKVRFLEAGAGDFLTGNYDAVLHLFEHDYPRPNSAEEPITFWHGVADVAWDAGPRAFYDLMRSVNLHLFTATVFLEDGRNAWGHVLRVSIQEAKFGPERHLLVFLVGRTPLAIPPDVSTSEKPADAE